MTHGGGDIPFGSGYFVVCLIATVCSLTCRTYCGGVRLFLADDAWSELTSGAEPVVRVAAADLGQARRARARLRGGAERVAVILDIEVTVAAQGDVRAAYASLDGKTAGVRYAGTVDGLAGLIADIESAEVADGVTLVAADSPQDLRGLGEDVLRRLAERGRISA